MPSLGIERMGSGTQKTNKKMKKTIGSLALVLSFLFLSLSCGDRSQNRLIVEASAIHDRMITKHDSLYSMLEKQEKRVDEILTEMPESNPDRVAYESMDRSIQRSYKLLESWREALEDEPSPSNYSGKGENSKKRSDKEILDIQKAYSTRLDEVGVKINELVTTMEMYTK